MAFCVHPGNRGNFTFGQAVSGFLTSPGLPFVDILSEQRIAGVFKKHNGLFGRTYTTAIVLWAFLRQVLRDGKEASCESAVARISSYLTGHALGDVDPDTRDYCRARAKLPEGALHELTTEVANEAERLVEPHHLWKGRHAKLVDGSTFMMPDTPSNQAAYPQNPAQKPGLGFPIARFVVVISLATACVVDCAIARYKGKETGETALLRQIDGCFGKGDVDVCFRKHQKRHTDFELREIRYVITKPGRKQDPFVIATTKIDVDGEDAVLPEELAELFGFRWNAELDIRSIKTHMNLNHLRCKRPEMVRKEFWVTMLAYNAIRTTALGSSWICGTRPREVSFVGCCQFVLAAWDVITVPFMGGTNGHGWHEWSSTNCHNRGRIIMLLFDRLRGSGVLIECVLRTVG
jgi:putative transposase